MYLDNDFDEEKEYVAIGFHRQLFSQALNCQIIFGVHSVIADGLRFSLYPGGSAADWMIVPDCWKWRCSAGSPFRCTTTCATLSSRLVLCFV